MKPWPVGAVGLISGRLDDPFCHPTPGHVLRQCFNCSQTVRVGVPNQKIEAEAEASVIVCVQCWRAYYDTGMPMVMLRHPEERTQQEESQDAKQGNPSGS